MKIAYRFKVFIWSFLFTVLTFILFYGLGTAYVNSRNAYFEDQISLIEIHRISFNKAEITIVGNKIDYTLMHKINATQYTLIPPVIRSVFIGFIYLDKLIEDKLNL